MCRRGQQTLLSGGFGRAVAAVVSSVVVSAIAACSEIPAGYKYDLAEHLTESGAKMYGAYWCPHCARQKDYFDRAIAAIPYVECDPEGFRAQPDACQAAGIVAYPTWVIDGVAYPGVQTLSQLAALSGFESPYGEEADSTANEAAPAENNRYSPADSGP